jgi:GNAT superfamily N-acetyltransferase
VLALEERSRYLPLTFPLYRELLKGAGDPGLEGVLSVGVDVDGEPAGLVLARPIAGADDARRLEVLSLLVTEEHRGRGLGDALVAELEAEARRRAVKGLDAIFEDLPEAAPLQALVTRRGGHVSEPVAHVGRIVGAEAIARMPLLSRTRLPRGYTTEPWSEVTGEERAALAARQDSTPGGWYPVALSPFRTDREEPAGCLALRRDGEVVGWNIAHRIDARTLRMTCLFVDPPLQPAGLAVPLVARAARALLELGAVKAGTLDQAVFVVYELTPRMARLARRHIEPYLASFAPLRRIVKELS